MAEILVTCTQCWMLVVNKITANHAWPTCPTTRPPKKSIFIGPSCSLDQNYLIYVCVCVCVCDCVCVCVCACVCVCVCVCDLCVCLCV